MEEVVILKWMVAENCVDSTALVGATIVKAILPNNIIMDSVDGLV